MGAIFNLPAYVSAQPIRSKLSGIWPLYLSKYLTQVARFFLDPKTMHLKTQLYSK